MTEGNHPEGKASGLDVCLETLGVAPGDLEGNSPEPLEGGVRNTVVRLTLSRQGGESTAILKHYPVQCKTSNLPSLDQERGLVEARTLKTVKKPLLDSVGTPTLREYSPEYHCSLLEDLSPKEPILTKNINYDSNFSIGQSLGRWLSTFHYSVRSPFENFLKRTSVYDTVRKSRISAASELLDRSDRNLFEEDVRFEHEHSRQVRLHGDFTPKNILIGKEHDPYLIDFEFCGKGAAEEDLGFFIGDVIWCRLTDMLGPEAAEQLIKGFLSGYESAYSDPEIVLPSRVLNWAAVTLFYRIRYPDSMPGQTKHIRERLRRTARQFLKADCSGETLQGDILTYLPV